MGELCSPTAIYLRPNCSGGNEDNADLLQKMPCVYHYTQCPQPCSRPPLTHTSAGDSWTHTGKSGSVSCRVTDPFSQVLLCTRFSLQESVFPVLCKFWWLYGGVNGDLLQEDLYHTQLCGTQSPCPTSAGDTQTLKSKSVSVSVGSPGEHVLFV